MSSKHDPSCPWPSAHGDEPCTCGANEHGQSTVGHRMADRFFGAEEDLSDFFAIQERWRNYPFADDRDSYWAVIPRESKLVTGPSREHILAFVRYDQGIGGVDSDTDRLWGECCEFVVSGAVSRRDDLVAVQADTQCDGNVCTCILDADKEVKL